MIVAGCPFERHEQDLCDPTTLADSDPGVFVLATDTRLLCTVSIGRPFGVFGDRPPTVGDDVRRRCTDRGEDFDAAMLAALDGHEIHLRSCSDGMRMETWIRPQRAGDGKVVGTLIVVRTTDHESVPLCGRRAEERLRRLVEYSPAIVGIRNGDDEVVQANGAYRTAFEDRLAPRGGALEQPTANRVREDLPEVRETVRRSRLPRVWEGRVPQSVGDDLHLLGHVFPLPLADGTTGVGETLWDLGPHDRARRQVAAAEQHFRAIFDGADMCIVLIDLNGRIVDANLASKRLTGRSRGDLRGRFGGMLTTRAGIEAHRPLWNELQTGQRSRYDCATPLRHSDGELRPVHCTMTLIRDEDGRPSGGLGMAIPAQGPYEPGGTRHGPDLNAVQSAVLESLAAGRSIAEIAADVGLTRRGVDYHIAQLRRRLRIPHSTPPAATTAELVARAYVLGVLDLIVWPPSVVEIVQAGTFR